ncbi:Protein of unknown function [Gryllus bimaculatus]|nr:Protein of unknown function [Gryllus bimaculatus]
MHDSKVAAHHGALLPLIRARKTIENNVYQSIEIYNIAGTKKETFSINSKEFNDFVPKCNTLKKYLNFVIKFYPLKGRKIKHFSTTSSKNTNHSLISKFRSQSFTKFQMRKKCISFFKSLRNKVQKMPVKPIQAKNTKNHFINFKNVSENNSNIKTCIEIRFTQNHCCPCISEKQTILLMRLKDNQIVESCPENKTKQNKKSVKYGYLLLPPRYSKDKVFYLLRISNLGLDCHFYYLVKMQITVFNFIYK